MKPVLNRNIHEAPPFLKKYNIDYDMKNYQNNGILKAGEWKFWYDSDTDSFMTNNPKYSSGKGFADIKELLAYALDIKEAKKNTKIILEKKYF